MEKEKRRKKLDEGRVDAELVINEIMEGVDLSKGGQDDAESKLSRRMYNLHRRCTNGESTIH